MEPGTHDSRGPMETILAIIAEERHAADLCLRCARGVSEPVLQAVLLRISATHLQHVRELQASLSDQDARAAITRQINAMFA